jgi:hypothetical protein
MTIEVGATTSWTRPPAVAGTFYPNGSDELRRMVRSFLNNAQGGESTTTPKAMIAPHAGYIFSGPIAASAYAHIATLKGTVERVILIGPSHRVALSGLATSSAAAFETPVGSVELDRDAINTILDLPQVHLIDEAHAREHSLEVHLPFLIEMLGLGSFKLVPLAMGNVSSEQIAEVFEALWGGRETLIVVSSDLSHYHDYDTANQLDSATSRAIEALAPNDINAEQACGRPAIQALLIEAQRHGLSATTVDQRNSGDTAGKAMRLQGRNEVVGYGAWIFR